MNAVVKCPVCGQDVSVDVSYNPMKMEERRYQHEDHYFYIDLPFLYGDMIINDDGIPEHRMGLVRKPKVLSDNTISFLADRLASEDFLDLAAQRDPHEHLRQMVRTGLQNSDDSKRWGEKLLLEVQSLLHHLGYKQEDELLLDDLMSDEGFRTSGNSLEMAIEPIEGTEMRSRSRYVRTLRDVCREFRGVYTHFHLTLLAAKSTQGAFALAVWITLTPEQNLKESIFETESQLVLMCSYSLNRVNDLLSQVEQGAIDVDEKRICIPMHRRGTWSDARIETHLPYAIRHLSTAGYGIVFNTGYQINSVLNDIDIDLMRFINEGKYRFYEFEEFTQHVLGKTERIGLGHNVLVYVLAPYWISILGRELNVDGNILVEWSCPAAMYEDLKTLLRVREDTWKTLEPVEETTESGDVYTRVTTRFIVPDMDQANFMEFIIEHPSAFRYSPRHPYLLNVGLGHPRLKTPGRPPTDTADHEWSQRQMLTEILNIKEMLKQHDDKVDKQHKSLEKQFPEVYELFDEILSELGVKQDEILGKLMDGSKDTLFIRRMASVIICESFTQRRGFRKMAESLARIQANLDIVAQDMKPDESLLAKAKVFVGKALRIPAGVSLINLACEFLSLVI